MSKCNTQIHEITNYIVQEMGQFGILCCMHSNNKNNCSNVVVIWSLFRKICTNNIPVNPQIPTSAYKAIKTELNFSKSLNIFFAAFLYSVMIFCLNILLDPLI